VFAGLLVVILLLVGLIAGSVSGFSDAMPRYAERLHEIEGEVLSLLEDVGVERDRLEASLDSSALLDLVSRTMKGLLGALSQLVVVILIAVFLLAEAADLPGKLRRATGRDDLSTWERASESVLEYVKVKAIVSLVTAVAVTILLLVVGVDFAPLWGVVAFLFNFIPNIGSILAAIPAVVLALVQFGAGSAVGVGLGYLVVNLLVGNVLEPRMMGRKLGLSPVVVLLSLIFWNWVLGPVGMLLSVPLTSVVRIAMEQSRDLAPLAVVLGTAHAGPEKPPSALV
jgi:predicted PurR-regulated permease PerM